MRLFLAVVLCVLGVAQCRDLTPEELNLLASTPYELLPQGLKDAIKRSKVQKRDVVDEEEEEGDRMG